LCGKCGNFDPRCQKRALAVKPTHFLLCAGLVASAWACQPSSTFEANRDLPQMKWHQDSVVSFSFTIDDAQPSYALSCHLRYGAAYKYARFYAKYELLDAQGRPVGQGMPVVFFFDEKTGQPLGHGLGDLFEREMVLQPTFKFGAPGRYTLRLRQYMRDPVLENLAAVGVKVSTAQP
jgi:gliding motility-associated lipoprotein GldH